MLAVGVGVGWSLGLFRGEESASAESPEDQVPAEAETSAETTLLVPRSTTVPVFTTTTPLAKTTSTVVSTNADYEILLTADSVVTSAGVIRLDDPLSQVAQVVADLIGTPPEPQGSQLCNWNLWVAGNESMVFLMWISPGDTLEVFTPRPLTEVGTDRGLEAGDSVDVMLQLYPDAEHVLDIEESGEQVYRLEPGANLRGVIAGDTVNRIFLGYDFC